MNWKFWSGKQGSKPKSKAREWWDAILFAVVAATLIRWLIMEPFTIPTSSMENSLLVGDFLFVSKFHYGTRTTTTPLQVPLTHQKIWGTEIPSYVDWIKLPAYRLPGFTTVKRGEVVVFNIPGIEEDNYNNPDKINLRDNPFDLKMHYVKRCVAIPGDTLEIKQGVVYTNGTREVTPENEQRNYVLFSKVKISKENLERFGIWNENIAAGPMVLNDNRVQYILSLSQGMVDAIRQSKASYILSLDRLPMDQGLQSEVFPYYHDNPVKAQQVSWTLNTFGPLWIPKEGVTIPVNEYNLAMYGETIIRYEHNDNTVIAGGSLTIDGKKLEVYTFKQDYYFMMGDNRDNSLDSRYWGFVPADHIVGKPLFIWFSTNKDKSFPASIRWDRIFKSAQE